MKRERKVERAIEKTVIDEFGEVKHLEQTLIFKLQNVSESSFIKTYLESCQVFLSIKSGTLKILFEIFSLVQYNTNQVDLNASIKSDIAKKLGFKEQTIRNAISELSKHQILIRISNNRFILNPFYFAKGEWRSIKKIRENLTVDFSPEGKIRYTLKKTNTENKN